MCPEGLNDCGQQSQAALIYTAHHCFCPRLEPLYPSQMTCAKGRCDKPRASQEAAQKSGQDWT